MKWFVMIMVIIYLCRIDAGTIEGPKNWDRIADAKQLPGKVIMVFVGPSKGQFTSSINLAMEKSKLSVEDYINEAKSYHEKVAESKVCRLGKMSTEGGEAELLQIDRETGWGAVRFVQAIIKVNDIAYVITATCLQEDFGQLSRAIFQTIRSFRQDDPKKIDCSIGMR